MAKLFNQVGGLKPGRSTFDLSHRKLYDADMGQLIPVCCLECVPGDHFKIGNQIVARMQPLVAPILHEIDIVTHYFFVPTRILWDKWEEFITGGKDGNYTGFPPTVSDSITSGQINLTKVGLEYTLWDYFDLPFPRVDGQTITVNKKTVNDPSSFPFMAYRKIWNDYYRDENLQDELELQPNNFTVMNSLLKRSWSKDYFTSSLPFLQRGTAPALPVNVTLEGNGQPMGFVGSDPSTGSFRSTITSEISTGLPSPVYLTPGSGSSTGKGWAWQFLDGIKATATTFNVSDLRLAFSIQKWQERNARAGVRYTEFLRSHFGVAPRDDRLQRPEYIGGTKSPIIVSEVLQTSSTDSTSPQGNMAGHGITADKGFVGSYFAKEYGYIIGISSIMPKAVYSSQGVPRMWSRLSRFDYYSPEFAHLSEQAVLQSELCLTNTNADNPPVFGYQGRFDEMRIKPSTTAGSMRVKFDYWHLAREFDTSVPPQLNSSFIECNPSKRIFAVQNERGFIVHHANYIRAVRPMPYLAEPGLIDHF